jgi:hypothetical protein
MTDGIFNIFKANCFSGGHALSSDTLKVALIDNSYSFSGASVVWTDIQSAQITGTGYTSGGATLSNASITLGDTTKFDADDVSWTSGTFSCSGAVVYNDTSTNKDLICYFDFGGNQSVSTGTFTLQFDTDGILTLT